MPRPAVYGQRCSIKNRRISIPEILAGLTFWLCNHASQVGDLNSVLLTRLGPTDLALGGTFSLGATPNKTGVICNHRQAVHRSLKDVYCVARLMTLGFVCFK